MASCTEARFASLGEEELNKILVSVPIKKDSQSTQSVISLSLSILNQYLGAKRSSITITDTFTLPELNTFLRTFYAEVRRANGEPYSKKSLLVLRYGLKRHFEKQKGIDIKNDAAFREANEMFQAVLRRLDLAGKGSVTHRDPISREDFMKIKSSSALNVNTPKGLQNKVFVDILLYVRTKPIDQQLKLSKTDVTIRSDPSGKRYVYFADDKQTADHDSEYLYDEMSPTGNRLYETGRADCPVESFIKYVSHLNPISDAFWQRPKTCITGDEAVWYCNAPLGKNTLTRLMQNISKKANTSRIYTNFSLKAVKLSDIHSEGFSAQDTTSVSTGRKTESLIKDHGHDEGARKRKIMSANPLTDKIRAESSNRRGTHTSTSVCMATESNATSTNMSDCKSSLPNTTPASVSSRSQTQLPTRSRMSEVMEVVSMETKADQNQDPSEFVQVLNKGQVFNFHNCTINIHDC